MTFVTETDRVALGMGAILTLLVVPVAVLLFITDISDFSKLLLFVLIFEPVLCTLVLRWPLVRVIRFSSGSGVDWGILFSGLLYSVYNLIGERILAPEVIGVVIEPSIFDAVNFVALTLVGCWCAQGCRWYITDDRFGVKAYLVGVGRHAMFNWLKVLVFGGIGLLIFSILTIAS